MGEAGGEVRRLGVLQPEQHQRAAGCVCEVGKRRLWIVVLAPAPRFDVSKERVVVTLFRVLNLAPVETVVLDRAVREDGNRPRQRCTIEQ